MKGFFNRSVALILLCTLVVTSLSVSSFATDYQSKYNFWNWAYDNSWFLGKLIIGSADNVCSVSEDTLHHSTNHQKGDTVDGEQQYTCICDDCGQTFNAVATDLANSYDDGSNGFTRVGSGGRYYVDGKWTIVGGSGLVAEYGLSIDSDSAAHVQIRAKDPDIAPYHELRYSFTAPADCVFYMDGEFAFQSIGSESYSVAFSKFCDVSSYEDNQGGGNPVDNVRHWNVVAGKPYRLFGAVVYSPAGVSGNVNYKLPQFYFVLGDDDSFVTKLPINIGGSVQYTDDNSNNKIYDAEFMDFSTNEYHNPVTDYSTKVDNWEYDYSTRTYTGYTENGEVKIVYGDENITVVEGGNTYNYYYAAPSSGGGGSGSDDGSSGDDEGLFGQLGELLGTLLGGLIDLITGVLSNVMDNLIALVTMTIEKLGSIVNLFGSFGDALRSLWSWLPDDIITILSAGVSVVIFACVIKLFI